MSHTSTWDDNLKCHSMMPECSEIRGDSPNIWPMNVSKYYICMVGVLSLN